MNRSLTVLYVSEDPTELSGALESQAWDVHRATTMLDALAMTVYFEPDLIVLDGDAPETRQTLWQLMSATGPSAHLVDLIVVLSDDHLTYESPIYTLLKKLPTSTAAETLIEQLPEWLAERDRQARRIVGSELNTYDRVEQPEVAVQTLLTAMGSASFFGF